MGGKIVEVRECQGAGVSLAFGTSFLLLACLIQLSYEGMCLVFYNQMCHVWLISLRDLPGGVDLGERRGWGRDWEEMSEKTAFSM